jgi:hypothetical protein
MNADQTRRILKLRSAADARLNNYDAFVGYRFPEKCPLHPKYAGLRKPTSKKRGCVCKHVHTLAVLRNLWKRLLQ